MKRFGGPLLALAVVVAIATGSVVLASSDGPYAYRVDGREVSQTDFDADLDVIHDHPALVGVFVEIDGEFPPGALPSVASARLMSLRIAAIIARAELARMNERVTNVDRQGVGYPTSGPLTRVPRTFRQRLIEDLATLGALGRFTDPDPEAVAEAIASVCPSGRYISHILVEQQSVAMVIKRDLDGGASFADLATANSVDTRSASVGGELGCLDDSSFVEPFQTIAATQFPGVVSEPFQTEVGWHLLLVTGPPADIVAAAEAEVAGLASQEALRGKAKVLVNERYGSWNDETGVVDPPKAPKE